MKINVELCEKLGVTIDSFPMKYYLTNDSEFFKNRDYLGKHWNRKCIRAVQAVLNSTKGKIGRGVEFFEEAFGRDLYHKGYCRKEYLRRCMFTTENQNIEWKESWRAEW